MPNMPDSYYDNFNASKNYEKILYRDGYTLQGAELNEAQSAAMHRLRVWPTRCSKTATPSATPGSS